MLGYVIVYLIIGAAFAVYLPIARARARHNLEHHVDPNRLAMMTAKERAFVMSVVGSSQWQYKTWHLIVLGLLWPTQVIVWLVAQVWSMRYARRIERGVYPRPEVEAVPVALCPGCGNDLMRVHSDAVQDPERCMVRLFCGHCNAVSDWNTGVSPPVLLATVRGAGKSLNEVVRMPRR